MEKQYSVVRMCPKDELLCFAGLFDNMTVDPYLKAGFRHKNILRVKVDGDNVNREPHEPLLILHGKHYVAAKDHDVRHYPEIPLDCHNELLDKAIKTYVKTCNISSDKEILVQAHRITSRKDQQGLPVVEGPHQDGMEYVCIMCISRHNIEGGVSQVLADQEKVLFEHTLAPGEMLILDDSEYFHHATPTQCKDDNDLGYRDILIFSTPSARPSSYLSSGKRHPCSFPGERCV